MRTSENNFEYEKEEIFMQKNNSRNYPAAELIVCEVCKRAYISFIKEGEKK